MVLSWQFSVRESFLSVRKTRSMREMYFSTFSLGFALRTCRFDSALWKIIPLLLDEGNKVEFFRRTKNEVWVSRKNSTLFPESSKTGIIFHSKLSNLQVSNAKPAEKVEKCIKLKSFLIFLADRSYSLTINCQDCALSYASSYILWSLQPFSFRPKLLINTSKKLPVCLLVSNKWIGWFNFCASCGICRGNLV